MNFITKCSKEFGEFSGRLKKVECNSSGISTRSFLCYVKAYSRTHTTLNVGINLTRNIDNFYVKHRLEYKYGTIYRTVMNPAAIDWCSFMNGTTQNLFYQVSLDIIGKSVPQLIHPCPYKDEVKALNITFDISKFAAVFPQGEYRNFWHWSDDTDSNIFTLIFVGSMRSPIKSSFG